MNKYQTAIQLFKMSFLTDKLTNVFQMVLKSSEMRKDGYHFSRFDSMSTVLHMVHKELSSSDFHKLHCIHDVILTIWDNYFMSHSNIPSRYNDRYPYHSKPKDRSVFESIIRGMIVELIAEDINQFIVRLFKHNRVIYMENKEIIHSVLKIVLQLPLEEMFEVSQTRSDLPFHLHVLHNVDKFIEVYIWTVLIILNDGYQYNFEIVSSDEDCSICCDTSKKEFVKIADGCRHSFCRSCFSKSLQNQKKCPMCRHEYEPINISDVCNRAIAVFFDERRKRNEDFMLMESNEKQCLIQFFEKHGFDMTTIYTEHPIRCFSDCGNLYTKGWKGTHKCGPNGDSHHATKHIGMASLSVLRPTDCCLQCQGPFHVYKECGHILCEAHLDPSKYCCPKCARSTYLFKLNI